MVEVKRQSLIKPRLDTPFHIDFAWWQKNDRDWHVYLRSFLCPEHQETYAQMDINEKVDWIDPETAEVQSVDGLQHVLITHCAKQPSFITQHTSLVDSIFRTFLANGNAPLTAEELSLHLGRDAQTILRTISAKRVYKGIRPCT